MNASSRVAASQPTAPSDTVERVDRMLNKAWRLIIEAGMGWNEALDIGNEAYALAEKVDYQAGMARALLTKGMSHFITSRYDETLRLFWQGLERYSALGDEIGEANANVGLGLVFNNMGEHNKALSFYYRALAAYERLNVQDFMLSMCYYGMGVAHFDKKELDTALVYYLKGHDVNKQIGFEGGLGRSCNNLGSVYMEMQRYDEAAMYLDRALEIYERQGHLLGLSRALHDKGKLLRLRRQWNDAHVFYQRALEVRTRLDYKQGLISTLLELGMFHKDQNHQREAVDYFRQALTRAQELHSKPKQALALEQLALINEQSGDAVQALHYYKQFHSLNAEVIREDSLNQIRQLEQSYALEKEARDKEMYRMRNIELAQMNLKLEHALDQINDSIAYARRIQTIILPTLDHLRDRFSDAFVFYLPRDVVSGDFYWMCALPECTLLAVVDCTGHGVPGAFMSLLGYSLLNGIVREYGESRPAAILDALDTAVVEVLRQRDDASDVHDGMDVALICVEHTNKRLHFAGANLPLYHVRNHELTELSADRQPIGGSHRLFEHKAFTERTISFHPGDQLYLFSDGFKDQFGWDHEQKRKYSSRRFRHLISRMAERAFDEHLSLLTAEFNLWKGELRQMDDVIVVGLQL